MKTEIENKNQAWILPSQGCYVSCTRCINLSGHLLQVAGIQQTYHQFHHGSVPRLFSSELTIPAFVGKTLLGISTILIVKFCSKASAKCTLPVVSNTLGIPIRSTSYVPTLNSSNTSKFSDKLKQGGYLQKLLSMHEAFDVDTGIRFLQYAGLAWSVVDLGPSLLSYVSLWCLDMHSIN